MEARLADNPWLAGDIFSLADIALLPYVLRLEHLCLDWFWREGGRVEDWLARCKARPGFRAISEHLDPKYLELMSDISADDRNKVRNLLDAAA